MADPVGPNVDVEIIYQISGLIECHALRSRHVIHRGFSELNRVISEGTRAIWHLWVHKETVFGVPHFAEYALQSLGHVEWQWAGLLFCAGAWQFEEYIEFVWVCQVQGVSGVEEGSWVLGCVEGGEEDDLCLLRGLEVCDGCEDVHARVLCVGRCGLWNEVRVEEVWSLVGVEEQRHARQVSLHTTRSPSQPEHDPTSQSTTPLPSQPGWLRVSPHSLESRSLGRALAGLLLPCAMPAGNHDPMHLLMHEIKSANLMIHTLSQCQQTAQKAATIIQTKSKLNQTPPHNPNHTNQFQTWRRTNHGSAIKDLVVNEASRRQWLKYHHQRGEFRVAASFGWLAAPEEENAAVELQRMARAFLSRLQCARNREFGLRVWNIWHREDDAEIVHRQRAKFVEQVEILTDDIDKGMMSQSKYQVNTLAAERRQQKLQKIKPRIWDVAGVEKETNRQMTLGQTHEALIHTNHLEQQQHIGQNAATKIQTRWRSLKCRRQYLELLRKISVNSQEEMKPHFSLSSCIQGIIMAFNMGCFKWANVPARDDSTKLSTTFTFREEYAQQRVRRNVPFSYLPSASTMPSSRSHCAHSVQSSECSPCACAMTSSEPSPYAYAAAHYAQAGCQLESNAEKFTESIQSKSRRSEVVDRSTPRKKSERNRTPVSHNIELMLQREAVASQRMEKTLKQERQYWVKERQRMNDATRLQIEEAKKRGKVAEIKLARFELERQIEMDERACDTALERDVAQSKHAQLEDQVRLARKSIVRHEGKTTAAILEMQAAKEREIDSITARLACERELQRIAIERALESQARDEDMAIMHKLGASDRESLENQLNESVLAAESYEREAAAARWKVEEMAQRASLSTKAREEAENRLHVLQEEYQAELERLARDHQVTQEAYVMNEQLMQEHIASCSSHLEQEKIMAFKEMEDAQRREASAIAKHDGAVMELARLKEEQSSMEEQLQKLNLETQRLQTEREIEAMNREIEAESQFEAMEQLILDRKCLEDDLRESELRHNAAQEALRQLATQRTLELQERDSLDAEKLEIALNERQRLEDGLRVALAGQTVAQESLKQLELERDREAREREESEVKAKELVLAERQRLEDELCAAIAGQSAAQEALKQLESERKREAREREVSEVKAKEVALAERQRLEDELCAAIEGRSTAEEALTQFEMQRDQEMRNQRIADEKSRKQLEIERERLNEVVWQVQEELRLKDKELHELYEFCAQHASQEAADDLPLDNAGDAQITSFDQMFDSREPSRRASVARYRASFVGASAPAATNAVEAVEHPSMQLSNSPESPGSIVERHPTYSSRKILFSRMPSLAPNSTITKSQAENVARIIAPTIHTQQQEEENQQDQVDETEKPRIFRRSERRSRRSSLIASDASGKSTLPKKRSSGLVAQFRWLQSESDRITSSESKSRRVSFFSSKAEPRKNAATGERKRMSC